MADNSTQQANANFATDERTIGGTAVHVQRVTNIGGTAINSGQTTVDTTAGGVQIIAAQETRKSVMLTNRGAVIVYVGTGTVTSSFYALYPGEGLTINSTVAIKGLAASSTAVMHYLEEYDS